MIGRNLFFLLAVFLGFGLEKPLGAQENPNVLTTQDLAWGETQVRQMLKDRPLMEPYASPGDPVWNWAVRQFAGEWAKGGIQWNSEDPNPLWDGMFYSASGDHRAMIRITQKSTLKNFHDGEPKPGPYLWYEVVFELSNLKLAGKAGKIDDQAAQGLIGKEEYCFRRLYVEEVDTRQEVHHFFMDLWTPNCQRLGLEPWGLWMSELNNREIPLFTPGEFIREYFSADYAGPQTGNVYIDSFLFHHQFYVQQYDERNMPLMLKAQIATPTPDSLPDLRRRMEAQFNPGGSPSNSPDYPANVLTSEDLVWGESQLRQMLKDRPTMADYVKEGDDLWVWMVRQFAGEWVKGGVEWDKSEPKPLWNSFFFEAAHGKKARIMDIERSALKSFHYGQPKTGPWLWYDAAFEMFTLRYSNQLDTIRRSALKGEIGPEEYCFKRMFLERVVVRGAVKKFFDTSWVSHCENIHRKPWDDYCQKVIHFDKKTTATASSFIRSYFSVNYSRPGGSDENLVFHHQYYMDKYEKMIAPSLRQNQVTAPAFLSMEDLREKMEKEYVNQ